MSVLDQTALALGRALLIGALALVISGPLSTWLAAQQGRARTGAWALLLAPFLTPALLISYAYGKVALAALGSPWRQEALYAGILALKLIPVAVIVRWLVPPPLSAEAWHCYRLSAGRASARLWSGVSFRLRGAGAGPWVAAGLVFLLAFADFELASLWNVRTWTVAIFDAQAGGLALAETLRLVAWPLAAQLTALLFLARGARRLAGASAGSAPTRPASPAKNRNLASWLFLASSAALVGALPLALVLAQAVSGFRTLAENFVLGGAISASVFFALAAALAAEALARRVRKRPHLTALLAVPGLLGALVVALLLLTLFQLPPLRPIYDTPLPLALALTLLLLPLALLLGALWPQRSAAAHVARQIGSRHLTWELETQPRAIALGLLFCWAYFDFTASSILAPVGLTPAFVRLHNLAHYGQTAVLSAMLLAACAVPVLTVLLAGAGARLFIARK